MKYSLSNSSAEDSTGAGGGGQGRRSERVAFAAPRAFCYFECRFDSTSVPAYGSKQRHVMGTAATARMASTHINSRAREYNS